MSNSIAQTRREWILSLRSGDYPQTTGRLQDPEGYCCLGVLAEMTIEPAWQPCENNDPSDDLYYLIPAADGLNPWIEMPPPEVLDSVGISEGVAEEFADFNDSGYNFQQMAAVLEDFFNWAVDEGMEPDETLSYEDFKEWEASKNPEFWEEIVAINPTATNLKPRILALVN